MAPAPENTRLIGSGSFGHQAEYFHRMQQSLAANATLAPRVVCADTFFIGVGAVKDLVTLGDKSRYQAELRKIIQQTAPLPLCVQPDSSGGANAPPTAPPPYRLFARNGTLDQQAQALLPLIQQVYETTAPAPALMVSALPCIRHAATLFPLITGEACAFNPYVWSEYIDPQAGVARLVLGLDLPLADHRGEDFTRVVALGAPQRRPEADFDDIAQHAQRRFFALNAETGQIVADYTNDLFAQATELPLDFLLSSAGSATASLNDQTHALTFERLLTRTNFVHDLKSVLRLLSEGFRAPAEIKFTATLTPPGDYQIQLRQAQPMLDLPLVGDLREQVPVGGVFHPAHKKTVTPLPAVARATAISGEILMEAQGAVLGRSRRLTLDRVLYIVPEQYARLATSARFEVARLLGRLNRDPAAGCWMLLGPGRWCTTSPELGLPTAFAEINHAAVVVEIVEMHENLTPDVSHGIHIFNDVVATDMLYLAIFPGHPHNTLARKFFEAAHNHLPELVPAAAHWANVLRVIETRDWAGARTMALHADSLRQRAVVYCQ